MAFNKQTRDKLGCLSPRVRMRMLSEQQDSSFYPSSQRSSNLDQSSKVSSQTAFNNDILIEKTIANIVNSIAMKNSKLDATRKTILEPITKAKIQEIMQKMKKGEIITAHDIDLATTASYKQALWALHMGPEGEPVPLQFASFDSGFLLSKNMKSRKFTQQTLHNNLMEKKSTSLTGFRDFMIDPQIEAKFKQNSHQQVKSVLDKQTTRRLYEMQQELSLDLKFVNEAKQTTKVQKQSENAMQNMKRNNLIGIAEAQKRQFTEQRLRAQRQYELDQDQEKQNLYSERVLKQDFNQIQVSSLKSDWAKLNAEDLKQQIKSRTSQFRIEGMKTLESEQSFIQKIGFKQFNSKKASQVLNPSDTIMNYFFAEKPQLCSAPTAKQKFVIKQFDQRVAAQNNDVKKNKFEIELKALVSNKQSKKRDNEHDLFQTALSFQNAKEQMKQLNQQKKKLEAQVEEDKGWQHIYQQVDKFHLKNERQQRMEQRRNAQIAQTQLRMQISEQRLQRLAESAQIL